MPNPTDEPEFRRNRFGGLGIKLTMNNYIFVLKTSVLSIAACSYNEALEILVFSVGIDEAADYLFSEL